MAAEFASSAAANAVGNVATEYASPYVGFFFRFGKIVEEFKKKRKQLELKKDRVKNDVNVAIRQTEVIEKDVQEWLEQADKELKETQKLEAEIERQKCFDWCPDWGWRYCLSKKVAKTTPRIYELLQKSDFQRVGIRPPLQGIEFFPSKDFKSSESSNLAFDGIMSALNTNGVNMIGLYGMPGVGKTTLAKEIGRQAKKQKLFENVVMVTMSQNPNVSNMQDKIAGLFGHKFEVSFEEGQAEELWGRLKEEKILVIIDDVWNEFKLQTIGIPFGDEHGACKILFTTRIQQVCVRMKCEKIFQLNILSEDDAWALFKDNAGLKDFSSTLNDIAKEVASECKGLPLAIVTIGKALNGATLDEWKVVNQRFKESRHVDNEDVCEDIYKCLQVSYDYLKGDNVKSCFLLCSLFPEDFLINIELLIMFGIGHGLFSHINSIEGLQTEIRQVLRKLQQSGLLLKSDGDFVSMHDVVRYFSHWITSRGQTMFMVKDGLTEWPRSESFGCYTAIAFWNCWINNFPDQLKISKLKIFVFQGKNFIRVSSAFVEGMKDLRILYLKNVIFSFEVFQSVRNLRTLYLEDCRLENISLLKILENLDILALLDTNIYELPKELVALHGLRSLHFSYRGEQQCNFPPTLLSRLTSLQELHVTCESNVNLSELSTLSRLTALSLRVSTHHQRFQENFTFPKLQRYAIAVNAGELSSMQGLKFRTLKIKEFSSSLSAFKELFCNVEVLVLEKVVMKHKNIVPDVNQEGLNELISLRMENCDYMECLMDMTRAKGPTTAFSNLVELNVKCMPCLKELCHGPPPISFLQKVRNVIIENCKCLKGVFQMDGILGNEGISETPLLSNLTSLDLYSLPELESIWKFQSSPTYHASLQSLKNVTIWECNNLKSIFSTCVAQSLLHLQKLNISFCNELEEVFNFSQEIAELEVPLLSTLTSLELHGLPKLKCIWKGPTHPFMLQSLEIVTIHGCSKLVYLFPASLAQSLVHLEQLHIWSCHSLEQVIMEEAANEDEIVSNMDDDSLRWPKLNNLYIINCRGLKYVFPITLAQGLPCLEYVKIIECFQLTQIFNMTKEKGGRPQQDIVLRSLQILELENLENLGSFCPENFVISLSLKEFKVRNCPRLSRLENQQGVALQAEVKDVPSHGFKELCNAKNVTMNEMRYHKSLISNVDPEGLNEVTVLGLKDGKGLECLIDTTDQGFFLTDAFFNLVELVIKTMAGFKMLCNGPFPEGFLQKLQKLETRNCMELVSLSPALQNLKVVRVINCVQLEQVFQTEKFLQHRQENEAPLLSKLRILELKSLPRLKWIWKGPAHYVCLQRLQFAEIKRCHRLKYLFSPSLAQTLVLLQQLKIEDCYQLEHITTELEIGDNIESDGGHRGPPLLPNLTTLRINHCPRLKYIFQIPFGQVLPTLKSVSITNSPQLKHVFNVAKLNNGVDRDAIGLPCLQDLVLEKLRNLACFCSENYPIVSPSLKKLLIEDCPRLEVSSMQQEINKEVQLKCPIQIANFQYLKVLKVSKHFGAKSLFSPMVAQNLSQLNFLLIKCCEELEEVIEVDHTLTASSSQAHLQPLSFPSLERIWIDGCGNLKSLFPISITCSLSKLRDIIIHRASKLEQVLGYQGELNVEDDQKRIVFPDLENLDLEELSSLKSFAPTGYHFRFPSLDYFTVTKCYKLTVNFSKSKLPGDARTKAPQPVENNATEGFTAIEEIVDNQTTCSNIVWRRWNVKDQIPIYMNVGETEIMLHEEMEKNQEMLVTEVVDIDCAYDHR